VFIMKTRSGRKRKKQTKTTPFEGGFLRGHRHSRCLTSNSSNRDSIADQAGRFSQGRGRPHPFSRYARGGSKARNAERLKPDRVEEPLRESARVGLPSLIGGGKAPPASDSRGFQNKRTTKVRTNACSQKKRRELILTCLQKKVLNGETTEGGLTPVTSPLHILMKRTLAKKKKGCQSRSGAFFEKKKFV